mmetsp:Transcript_35415/g.100278  ORF Transcript_35415/g.100278 Transcript_35415/m.100278 type:complete len:350 (+) Transcript_35415:381-1430(+)
MPLAEGNVALAFTLVISAGLCTCLGSCLVFCTSIANSRILAASLGVSAGVMLYVSFSEIFMVKSVDAFAEHFAGQPNAEAKALRAATYCFFSGIAFIALLNMFVHWIDHVANRSSHREASEDAQQEPSTIGSCLESQRKDDPQHSESDQSGVVDSQAAQDLEAGKDGGDGVTDGNAPETELSVPSNVQLIIHRTEHHNGLQKMGIMTGIAIGIHNFPEGLATFVAALAEPSAGIALAVAIALHNIPEGVCVAMPVYYATGSKWKGFFWSLLSGITEPIGGLVGYLILWNSVTPLTYAVLFGMVGGMMVYISLRELLPMALKYDPEDKVVTASLFAGMVVMAASLLVFTA